MEELWLHVMVGLVLNKNWFPSSEGEKQGLQLQGEQERAVRQAAAPVSLQRHGNAAGLWALSREIHPVCAAAPQHSANGTNVCLQKAPYEYELCGCKFLWSVVHAHTTLIRGFVSCSFWRPCISQI